MGNEQDINDPTEQVEAAPEAGVEAPPADAVEQYLLDRLLYKGVLPKYAFPTDVAGFYVFDGVRSRPNWPVFRFSPSQGLAIALTQYAPGKQVWIASKLFVSGALYSPIRGERFRAWHERRLYYECTVCHYALTKDRADGQRGETLDCPACGNSQTLGGARVWLRPPGFAHPVYVTEDTTPDDQPARAYATRAKLEAPTPAPEHAGWKAVSPHVRALHLRDNLLVTNTGPRQEGYNYCTRCGAIEQTAASSGRLGAPHGKPYPDQREPMCTGGATATGICLGMDFLTDVLLLSTKVEPPLRLLPGRLATDIALRTLSEALSKAAAVALELETGELQAEYRPAVTADGPGGLETEVYLYDTLTGGAGFARRVGDRCLEVLRKAMDILRACDCDLSCYKCLRSYKNKFEHDRLDRIVGVDLLSFLLDGTMPSLSPKRFAIAADILAQDVQRQAGSSVTVSRGVKNEVPGIGTVVAPIHLMREGQHLVVAVTHPLTPTFAQDDAVNALAEYSLAIPVHFVDELKIRRNLPAATKEVLSRLGVTAA